MNKKGNGWKTTAFIFIGLWLLTVGTFIWLIAIGTEAINNETECAVNVCEDDTYTAYFYDDMEGVCYCYSGSEIVYQKYIK